jgi:putative nucleotidyltransferase with HDIG domain
METEAFFQKLDQIKQLATLPVILQKVNRMLLDHETSMSQLTKIIESDQAITAKLLRMVNSAFYGFRAKIGNIPHAVVILGFNSIRNALISLSVLEFFDKASGAKRWDPQEFWVHSVSTAIFSKDLAEKTHLAVPDDSFTAGLLHDMGRIVLAQYFSEEFHQILAAMRRENLSFHQAEKGVYPPLDHARIGGYIAENWQFPPTLVEAIQCHHSVRRDLKDLGLVLCVYLGDRIAHERTEFTKIDPNLLAIVPDSSKALIPHLENIERWLPQLSAEIEAACRFFLQEN